ncbi:MAG: metal ABC transporter substrate-binding protein [bacterium]
MNDHRKTVSAAVVVLLAVGALAASLFTGTKNETNSDRTVSATIFPLYDIVRNVAGESLTVALLLPPGASPHTYEPTPSIIRQVNSSAAVYALGHGVDAWAETLAASANRPVMVVDGGITLRTTEDDEQESGHDEKDEHGHDHDESDGTDPHYWLTIPNAERIAENVAADLSVRFPELSPEFEANLKSYRSELQQADVRMREIMQQVGNRQIVTLHDAWYYFAEEYGLTIVGSFVPAPGREPTPQYLMGLGDAVDRADTKTLFSEPQLSTEALEPFLRDHDLTVATLDPLGGTGSRLSYIDNMIANAETIAENQ